MFFPFQENFALPSIYLYCSLKSNCTIAAMFNNCFFPKIIMVFCFYTWLPFGLFQTVCQVKKSWPFSHFSAFLRLPWKWYLFRLIFAKFTIFSNLSKTYWQDFLKLGLHLASFPFWEIGSFLNLLMANFGLFDFWALATLAFDDALYFTLIIFVNFTKQTYFNISDSYLEVLTAAMLS